jgi:hydrogenase/urease accessory protein HupE
MRSRIVHWVVGLALLCMAAAASAHELRPAFLELRQTAAQTYAVLWKVPGLGEEFRLGVYARLPSNCSGLSDPRTLAVDNTFIDRWDVRFAGELAGGTITIDGLSSTVIDVLVRIERLDGAVEVARLTPSSPAFVVQGAPGPWQSAMTYTTLGIEHILYGLDHLLFVFGLLLLVRDARALLKTITAFTVAHSLTLAAATFGYVQIAVAPVEATIALSILFLAVELMRSRSGAEGLAQRAPWIVAFCFGLLHGLGFASTLSRMGLPPADIPLALLLFNVGVELGQLGFVLVVVAVVRSLATLELTWPKWVSLVPIYGLGSFAALIFWQRVSAIAFNS